MTTRTAAGGAIAWWVGLVGHLVMAFWYAASGLVAPPYGVVTLLVIWGLLLVAALVLRTRRPLWVLALPVLDVAIWFGLVSAGDAFLNWTA